MTNIIEQIHNIVKWLEMDFAGELNQLSFGNVASTTEDDSYQLMIEQVDEKVQSLIKIMTEATKVLSIVQTVGHALTTRKDELEDIYFDIIHYLTVKYIDMSNEN